MDLDREVRERHFREMIERGSSTDIKNISLRAKRARLSFCVPSFENTYCAKRGRCAVGDAEFLLGLIQLANEATSIINPSTILLVHFFIIEIPFAPTERINVLKRRSVST